MKKLCFVVVFIVGCISAPTKERIAALEKQKTGLLLELQQAADKSSVEVEGFKLQLEAVTKALEEAKAKATQERVDSGVNITGGIVDIVEPLTRGLPFLGQIMGVLAMVLSFVRKK